MNIERRSYLRMSFLVSKKESQFCEIINASINDSCNTGGLN